jgi:hypothetical protein
VDWHDLAKHTERLELLRSKGYKLHYLFASFWTV